MAKFPSTHNLENTVIENTVRLPDYNNLFVINPIPRDLPEKQHDSQQDIVSALIKRSSESLRKNFPCSAARYYGALPIEPISGHLKTLHFATFREDVEQIRSELKFILNSDITFEFHQQEYIIEAIERSYNDAKQLLATGLQAIKEAEDECLKIPSTKNTPLKYNSGFNHTEDNFNSNDPLLKFINSLIHLACQNKASDIFIVPLEQGIHIRYKIDGIVYDNDRSISSLTVHNRLVRRLKVLAKLESHHAKTIMDGEFNWSEGLYKCNVRMAIIPTIWGDRVTLRIHYKESHRQICTLSKLKLQSKILEELNNYTQKKPGLAIFAGPTGSGKTTLLYALLLELKAKGKEILTIEDPVELTLPGISQCSIRPESGLTFASALKSILRHCPDVIMIGEVRDAESANAMIQAALTGHYVLTTTHATDVSGVITRLVEFGIKESMIKEATRLIVVQNLMPTLCRVCRKKESDSCYWYSSGCESCLWRGFKGRVPVNEFLSGDIRLLNLGSNYFNDMCPGLRYSSMQQSIDQAKRNGLISTSCQ